ncbi:MAG TPA: hypothetical protein PLN12_16030, partial [Flavobacteriales bacterium]|nr:hypothetical protein [Flavobacteriales bacterium]
TAWSFSRLRRTAMPEGSGATVFETAGSSAQEQRTDPAEVWWRGCDQCSPCGGLEFAPAGD